MDATLGGAQIVMKEKTAIMVSSDDVLDAKLVRDILSSEYKNITLSLEPEKAVSDFEGHEPKVLILAFKKLEISEQYYLRLFRMSPNIHTIPHSAIVLTTMEGEKNAYELCRQELFDDYVLFWPFREDRIRLLMTVRREVQYVNSGTGMPSNFQMRTHAKGIAMLESAVRQGLDHGNAHLTNIRENLDEAKTHMSEAVNTFSERLISGGMGGAVDVKDAAAMEKALRDFQNEGIEPPLGNVYHAVSEMSQWSAKHGANLKPHLDTARKMVNEAGMQQAHILIVDDDPAQCKLLAHILLKEGYDVEIAFCGARALSCVNRRRPDVLLLDYEMPNLSGLDVAKRIKATPQLASIPILMITAHREKAVVVECIRAGVIDFLLKPFKTDAVLQRVANCVALLSKNC
jgi:CheY-like chemotaxis protein